MRQRVSSDLAWKKTCWIVSSGTYSDYGVHAVYTSKKEAIKITQILNTENKLYHGDYFQVEPLPVNPVRFKEITGRRPFYVYMQLDGAVANVELNVYARFPPDRAYRRCMDGTQCICVWAADEEHAIKIASERRAEEIASGIWPEK